MEEKEPKKIIGLMSGTSCDSIDAGLCEVFPDLSCKLIAGTNTHLISSQKFFRHFLKTFR